MKTLIISGSARKNGETNKVVKELQCISGWNSIDLVDYNISHFDYEHKNRNDDFIQLVQKILENYDVLIFATPVYWYSMSGIMKMFIDRITDLLKIEKEKGRKLRGKYMAVMSSSNGGNLEDQFWQPFKKSADYLGMHYLSDVHTYQGKSNKEEIAKFHTEIVEGYNLNQKARA